MQYTNVYTDEIVPSSDFEAGFAATVGNIAGLVEQLLFTTASCVILTGLSPAATAAPGGTLVVSAGQAWQDGQSIAVVSSQTLNILSGTADAASGVWGTGLQADASNPRIDVVAMQYTATASAPATRTFVDPSTNAQYTQSVNTLTVDGYTFEVVHGVAAATPVAPAVAAGWVVLAEVYVPAASTTVVNSNITDETPSLRVSGGALGNVTGQAFVRNDAALNTAPEFTWLPNTLLNLGPNTLADVHGVLTLAGSESIQLTGPVTVTGELGVAQNGTFTNNGVYAGSPVLTGLTAGTGVVVNNPSAPGAATVAVSGVPNTSLTGPLVNAVSAGTGLAAVNPSGVGAVALSVSGVPNASLNGPLVNALAAGTGITVNNPTGVGAGTVAVDDIPNAALVGPLVNALTVADGLSVTNPAGVGEAVLGITSLANSLLVGPLVNGLTAGTGITVNNPAGVGAATVGVSNIPNSALTGALVAALAAADASVLVTNPGGVGTASVAVNPAYAMTWTAAQTFGGGAAVSSGQTLTVNGVVAGTAYGGANGLATLDVGGNVPADELGNVSAVLPPPSPATTTALGAVLLTVDPPSGDPVAWTTADPRTNRLTDPLSYAWPF